LWDATKGGFIDENDPRKFSLVKATTLVYWYANSITKACVHVILPEEHSGNRLRDQSTPQVPSLHDPSLQYLQVSREFFPHKKLRAELNNKLCYWNLFLSRNKIKPTQIFYVEYFGSLRWRCLSLRLCWPLQSFSHFISTSMRNGIFSIMRSTPYLYVTLWSGSSPVITILVRNWLFWTLESWQGKNAVEHTWL